MVWYFNKDDDDDDNETAEKITASRKLSEKNVVLAAVIFDW